MAALVRSANAFLPTAHAIFGGEFSVRWMVASLVLLALSHLASALRWHVILTSHQMHVHFVATVESLFCGWGEGVLRFLGRRHVETREAMYARAYGFDLAHVERAGSWDRLWNGDFVSAWWAYSCCSASAQIRPASAPQHRRRLFFCVVANWVLECTAWVAALAAWIPETAWSGKIVLGVMASRCLGGICASIGGLGVRDYCLWMLVAPAPESALRFLEAVVALRVAQALGWGIGWRVGRRAEKQRVRAAVPSESRIRSISIVMPVLNEAEALEATLLCMKQVPEVRECIVVDGGSSDGTVAMAQRLECRVIGSAPGRGIQMRAGAALASGDVIMFLHADTWLPADAGAAVLACLRDRTVVAGGFWKRFRQTPWLLLGSRPKCAVRVWVGRRVVGDMAMFVRREALNAVGGVPEMALMEDFELSGRLRQIGRLALAPSTVSTSARRFRQRGVLMTYLKMWQVTWLYRLGRPSEELRKRYG